MNTCADCGRKYSTEDWDGETPCPSDDCPSHSQAMDPETLDGIYNQDGDGEHPKYPRALWREQVAEEYTLSGYWQWVSNMLHNE